jgi:LacI family transcriptional regulator
VLPIRLDQSFSLPLSAQLADQISWLIASGHLAVDDELPAARDLAADLGVNFHTVRAAYQRLAASGHISMGRGRRSRVLPLDARTPPERSAARRTGTIGVIIPAFVPFFSPFLDGVEAATADLPAMPVFCNARNSEARAAGFVDQLTARGVDGIIAAAVEVSIGAVPPTVLVDQGRAPSSIEFDLERAQLLATSHLIAHGHERIGIVTPSREPSNFQLKHAGHVRALREAGLHHDLSLTVEAQGFDMAAGTAAAEQLLALPEPPTAIAATTDTLAIGVFHALTSRGLRVPDDMALIGNDDIDMASVIRPTLSTVALPAREAGRLAVERLRRLIDGETPDEPLVLDVELVERESCGCTASSV